MKLAYDMTNEEILSCIQAADCITDPDLVRSILGKEYVMHDDGSVDEAEFAEYFALAIEGFITEEQDTDEYNDAWDTNYNMGYELAEAINSHLETL